MATKLNRRAETEDLTFEIFDLDLDENEQAQLADDPRGFLTELLEAEGQVVNELLVSADEMFLKPDGSNLTAPGVVSPNPPHPPSCSEFDGYNAVPRVWH